MFSALRLPLVRSYFYLLCASLLGLELDCPLWTQEVPFRKKRKLIIDLYDNGKGRICLPFFLPQN
jgi:hypothetical protein